MASGVRWGAQAWREAHRQLHLLVTLLLLALVLEVALGRRGWCATR